MSDSLRRISGGFAPAYDRPFLFGQIFSFLADLTALIGVLMEYDPKAAKKFLSRVQPQEPNDSLDDIAVE